MITQKIQVAINNLMTAIDEAAAAWESAESNEEMNRILTEGYPFHICFNELTRDVRGWGDTVIQSLNTREEYEDTGQMATYEAPQDERIIDVFYSDGSGWDVELFASGVNCSLDGYAGPLFLTSVYSSSGHEGVVFSKEKITNEEAQQYFERVLEEDR